MIKKACCYFWSLRRQFIKYAIVGTSGFIIDMLSLIFLKQYVGINATIAVVINQSFLLAYNFSLNKYWSFRNTAVPHRQLVRYLTLAACNYLFAVVTMYIFNEILGYDYRLVRLLTIMVAVSWNFFLYKYWVYKDDCSEKE